MKIHNLLYIIVLLLGFACTLPRNAPDVASVKVSDALFSVPSSLSGESEAREVSSRSGLSDLLANISVQVYYGYAQGQVFFADWTIRNVKALVA